MFHCNDLRHTKNDGIGPGGLMAFIEYQGSRTVKETVKERDRESAKESHDMNHEDM